MIQLSGPKMNMDWIIKNAIYDHPYSRCFL